MIIYVVSIRKEKVKEDFFFDVANNHCDGTRCHINKVEK